MDNMYYIIKTWNQKTNNATYYLSFDNNAIQATADVTMFTNPDDPADTIPLLPNGIKLPLPAYSHDLNRPIEHIFGTVKHLIRTELYADWDRYKDAAALQGLVWQVFHNLAVYNMQRHVEADVAGLPLLWLILSTPAGILFADDCGKVHVGTGGDYPNAIAR